MKALELKKNDIYHGDLLLVNVNHALYQDDATEFVPVDMRFPTILMKEQVANSLRLVFQKISSDGFIVPVSGYRSSSEQTEIFNDSLLENGEEFTRKYVALPNHSEHQTGLAIDLALNKEEIDFICPDFPYDGICNEFRKVAPDYGLIERYAKDKEQITGISHEPWHFRYVGFPHAKIITEKNFALEEYIDFIKSYRKGSCLTYTSSSGTVFEIYYVPAEPEKTTISIPEDNAYQISGNNVDGFIITLWRKYND